LGKNDRKGGHRNGGWGTSTSAMTVVGNEILCASNDGEFYRFGWTRVTLKARASATASPTGLVTP